MQESYDAIGIGVGPANISLAVALHEARPPVRFIALDKAPSFSWHGELLLPGAVTMDTFIEDGVLLRNPRSRFTLLSYLHVHGWLQDFNNLRQLSPSRRQYSDYLAWVCRELGNVARFGEEVSAIEPIGEGDSVRMLRVVSQNIASGRQSSFLTKNVVIATGGVPSIPPGITTQPEGRVFHASQYLSSIERVCPHRDNDYHIVVVGSGQTGAEIFLHLVSHYPRARVTATLRKFGYRLQDDSPFAWDLYYSQVVDHFFGQTPEQRLQAMGEHLDTNYGVVSWRVLKRMYDHLSEDRLSGKQRLQVLPNFELTSAFEKGETVNAAFFSRGIGTKLQEIECDALVLASGYQRRPPTCLEPVQHLLERDAEGRLMADRQYRVRTSENFTANIYLQGFCEHTHGVGDANLPIIPTRSAELAATLVRSVHGVEMETV